MDTVIATPARLQVVQLATGTTTSSQQVLSRLNSQCHSPTIVDKKATREWLVVSKKICGQSLKWLSSMGSVSIQRKLRSAGKRRKTISQMDHLHRESILDCSASSGLVAMYLLKTSSRRAQKTCIMSRVN